MRIRKNIVRIVVDSTVSPTNIMIGGVRIITPRDDADLGRELRTTEVRVHDSAAAYALRVDLLFHHGEVIEVESEY